VRPRWCEQTDLPRSCEKSPPVRPASARAVTGAVRPGGYHRTPRRSDGSTSDSNQTTWQSGGGCRPSAFAPRCAPAGWPSNRSAVFASFATPLPPQWRLVCCIDRLNPPARAFVGWIGTGWDAVPVVAILYRRVRSSAAGEPAATCPPCPFLPAVKPAQSNRL
jgi:hypothetical protein